MRRWWREVMPDHQHQLPAPIYISWEAFFPLIIHSLSLVRLLWYQTINTSSRSPHFWQSSTPINFIFLRRRWLFSRRFPSLAAVDEGDNTYGHFDRLCICVVSRCMYNAAVFVHQGVRRMRSKSIRLSPGYCRIITISAVINLCSVNAALDLTENRL